MIARYIVATMSALLFAGQVHATRTGYDVEQNIITIPSVQIDGVRYNFPRIRPLSFEVVDTGIVSQVPAGSHVCVSGRDAITQANFDLIKIGMTLDDVNKILGCQYNPPARSIHDSCTGCNNDPYESFTWGFGLSNVITVHVDNVTHRIIGKRPSNFID